jgi:hypothetical protein
MTVAIHGLLQTRVAMHWKAWSRCILGNHLPTAEIERHAHDDVGTE